MARALWTRDQLLSVLKLYCQTPFGRLHSRNPEIVALARDIGRTPSAIALKAVNFASLDPTIDRKGMSNTSALDRTIWDEFFANMQEFIADTPLAYSAGGFSELEQSKFIAELPIGSEKIVEAKVRQNQGFFRQMILASYNEQCAISGISSPNLLVASHIIPWSKNPDLRTNPRNGICLNALHDRAFDRGLITFGDDLSIIYSQMLDETGRSKLGELGRQKLILPTRFLPDKEFLAFHRAEVFQA